MEDTKPLNTDWLDTLAEPTLETPLTKSKLNVTEDEPLLKSLWLDHLDSDEMLPAKPPLLQSESSGEAIDPSLLASETTDPEETTETTSVLRKNSIFTITPTERDKNSSDAPMPTIIKPT